MTQAAPASRPLSMSAAVVLVFRNTGVSVGVTVSAVVIAGAGLAGQFRDEAGFTRAFLIAAAGAVAAFLLAAWLPRRAGAGG